MRSFARLIFAIPALCLLLSKPAQASDEELHYGRPTPAADSDVLMYQRHADGGLAFLHGSLAARAPGRTYPEALIEYVSARTGYFRLDNAEDALSVKTTETDELGMVHVRLDQHYEGIPVIGGELIGHFEPDGKLATVNGYTHSGISIDPAPKIELEEAISIAGSDLRSFFAEGTPAKPTLVILPRDDRYYLCWRLMLTSDTPPGRWEYFVDAHDGTIVFKANRIKELAAVGTGIGVMGQWRYHIDTELNGYMYFLTDSTRQANNNVHGHDGLMPDGGFIQTNTATTSLPGSVAMDGNNEWTATSQAPAVDAHVYASLVYDYWLHHLNRNGYDGNGASMLTIVGYTAAGYNNAYWDGSRVVIWAPSGDYRSLAGCPDVLAHEWAHALTEHCSDLVYQSESGALDEAFSDILGAAFEYAHDTLDEPDWLAGENAHPDGAGFRDMADPHAFNDPEYYGSTDPYWIDTEDCEPSLANDWCGVHTNSGVGNKWFQLLSDGGLHHGVTVTGIGVQNAVRIAYRANRYYWTSTTEYHNAALGTIAAAQDLDTTDLWTLSTATAWNAVGVSTPGPSLVFDYPDSLPLGLTPFEPDSFRIVVRGTLGGTPIPGSARFHYRIGGEPWTTAIPAQTSPNHYSAVIPAQPCGSEVEYYVSAQLLTGQTLYDPDPSAPRRAFPVTEVTTMFDDNGETDQGWTVSGDAVDGHWERGVPAGGGDRGDPTTDFDGSGACWLTDNHDDNSDVDDGRTSLVSPLIDASGSDALVSYTRWYSNGSGASPYEDTMFVYVSNDSGNTWVEVESVGPVEQADGDWFTHSFWLSEFVEPTGALRLRFDVADYGEPSIVEAGIDAVRIERYACSIPPVTIATDSLPDWTAGLAYTQQLQATGGVGPLIWSAQGTGLVGTGLTLSSDGVLAGTPGSAATILFTAAVTDSLEQTSSRQFTIQINTPVQLVTGALPDWTEGAPYELLLASSGGTGPVAFEDVGQHLDAIGLRLGTDGLIQGPPTDTGNVTCTVKVTDNVGDWDQREFTFRLNPGIGFVTDSLPQWTIGYAYEQTIEAEGGTGLLTFSDATSGLTGSGLTLSSEGTLSGIPVLSGSFELTVAVTDEGGDSAAQVYDLVLNDTVLIPDQMLPYLHPGQEYTCSLVVTGGTPPLLIEEVDSVLQDHGLVMSNAGVVSGLPLDSTSISFSVRATDVLGSTAQTTLLIEPAPDFICGDLNGSGQMADISDLVYMVDYMFNFGDAPSPLEAADVNASGGLPDISDLVYMVEYMFRGGPPLTCPTDPAAVAPASPSATPAR